MTQPNASMDVVTEMLNKALDEGTEDLRKASMEYERIRPFVQAELVRIMEIPANRMRFAKELFLGAASAIEESLGRAEDRKRFVFVQKHYPESLRFRCEFNQGELTLIHESYEVVPGGIANFKTDTTTLSADQLLHVTRLAGARNLIDGDIIYLTTLGTVQDVSDQATAALADFAAKANAKPGSPV